MEQAVVIAFALVLSGMAGCGASSPAIPDAPSEAPRRPISEGELTRIAFVFHGVWGVGRTEWWIDASGRGSFASTGYQGRPDVNGTFEAGPAGFAEVSTLVSDLEGVIELPCEQQITDQAMGAVTWTRGGAETMLGLDDGCTGAVADAAQAKVTDATTLVRSWATDGD